MSTILVPGPSYHFLGVNNVFEHVGFVQRETRLQFLGAHRGVEADYAGGGMDADTLYLGETAVMALQFVRYNEPSLNKLKGRLRGGTAGGGGPGTIGTLLLGEQKSFQWAVVSAYASKTVFTAAQMNGAYYFPAVFPADAIEFNLAAVEKIESVLLRSHPTFNNPDGSFAHYQIGLPSGITLPSVA